MCLGGGGGPSYQYKEPVKYNPPPGPPSPPDMVNNMELSDTGDFSQKKDSLKVDKKPAAQSTKNTGLY
tara:strand:- start:63 stop:266 length:204 start_codon:yes stop_codon:yes gene_type:complete